MACQTMAIITLTTIMGWSFHKIMMFRPESMEKTLFSIPFSGL